MAASTMIEHGAVVRRLLSAHMFYAHLAVSIFAATLALTATIMSESDLWDD